MVGWAFGELVDEVRHAGRALRRDRGFLLAALLTLALGIGATTATFSVVNAALLTPPPYPDADRLLVLSYPDGGSQNGQVFHYVRDRVRSFECMAAHGGSSGWNLVVGPHAEYVRGVPVSGAFFDVLGVRPSLGRGFDRSEDSPGGARSVVLSDPIWRRVFGARPDVLGEVVSLGGVPHAVVGVMPASFRSIPAADVWTPLQVSSLDSSWNYTVLGRLRAGASLAQAAAELDTLLPALPRDLSSVSDRRARSLLWMSYQQALGLDSRQPLLLLLGAVGVLLLIACTNVAGLQVVRGVVRRHEMATRMALGGGRARLVRQMLTESVLLGLAGAALGLVVTRSGIRALLALVPEGLLSGQTVAIDWRVLGVTLAVALGAGMLFGLPPALGALRVDLRAALWEGARQTASRHTLRVRRAFGALEVALAVVLLVAAGLLARTLVNLRAVDLGFDPSNVVVGKMSLQGSTRQGGEQLATFFDQTLARVRLLPGVVAAAVSNGIPVERGVNLPFESPPDGLIHDMRAVDWRYVTPQYFEVFRIARRAGRTFDEGDGTGAAPVALVNETFERSYFGSGRALGRYVQVERHLGDPPREVVGVIADVKATSGSGWTQGPNALGTPSAPTVYVPAAQAPEAAMQIVHHFFPVSWAIRTRGPQPDVVAKLEQIVRSVDPTLPFIRFETMDEVIAKDLDLQRFLLTLVGVFATLALLLASVGLYGLVAYSASQRTQEVGIRVALGATRVSILCMFVGEGLTLALAGLAAGLLGAAATTRLLAQQIYGVTALDFRTFATAAVVLVAVAVLASSIPASRAARAEPSRALRVE